MQIDSQKCPMNDGIGNFSFLYYMMVKKKKKVLVAVVSDSLQPHGL